MNLFIYFNYVFICLVGSLRKGCLVVFVSRPDSKKVLLPSRILEMSFSAPGLYIFSPSGGFSCLPYGWSIDVLWQMKSSC